MHQIWDEDFEVWRKNFLRRQEQDKEFSDLSKAWLQKSVDYKYSYQFDWLGVPIIQMPGDLLVFQDIVFKSQPDLIIETGVARGGSLVFWASIQKLCGIEGRVLGIDIEVRDHALKAINNSSLSKQIELIQGSSTDLQIFSQVRQIASGYKRIMVVLDSNHTHEHVLAELNLYAGLVSSGCFLLVLDTVIDDLNVDPERSWGPDANPKTAIEEFMKNQKGEFVNGIEYETRAAISVAPKGYWIRK